MNRNLSPAVKVSLAGSAIFSLALLLAPVSRADSYTFTGTGDWYTTGTSPNWSPTVINGLSSNFLSVAGNSVTINGTVNYNAGPAGGDFQVGNGDTMTIDGSTASWTQTTNNYVKIGTAGGTSIVSKVDVANGGAFNVFYSGTGGTQLRIGLDGGAGSLTVESTGGGLNLTNSGTLTNNNLLIVGAGSTVSLLGGTNSLSEINSSGTVTFGGGTTTTGQWDNAAATYNVTGGTVKGTNYDMNTAGATFSLSGGSVAFSGNFTNLRNVTISGGSVSVAGTLNTNAFTLVNMTAGILNSSGGTVNLNSAATFALSGTAQFKMTGAGEFQPGYTFTAGQASNQSISGNAAISVAGIVAFQGGNSQKFDVNGGSITIGGSGYNGIFSNGAYFNFTNGSTGYIDLTGVTTQENAVADITAGKIRYNDTAYTSSNYSSMFNVFSDGKGGWEISLAGLAPVPEPATWAGGVLLMGVAGWFQRRSLSAMLGRMLSGRWV